MLLDTGEELLAATLGDNSPLTIAAQTIEPFIVPYDQLARIDGWVVWLGHPPVPGALNILPAPDHLLWDEPPTAIAVVAALAADYAARRGARSPDTLRRTLARESPVAVVTPGPVAASLRTLLSELAGLDVPILDQPSAVEEELAVLPSFALRHTAHARPVGRLNDPSLSFQSFVTSGRAGGDALSTYVLHTQGEHDGVTTLGDCGEHLGIEIGIRNAGITDHVAEALEHDAARIPSFLSGVTSQRSGDTLEIGWRPDARPSAHELGEVIHVWLKALHGLELVDVRVAFAPAGAQSPVLSEMRARAISFRLARAGGFATNQSPD